MICWHLEHIRVFTNKQTTLKKLLMRQPINIILIKQRSTYLDTISAP